MKRIVHKTKFFNLLTRRISTYAFKITKSQAENIILLKNTYFEKKSTGSKALVVAPKECVKEVFIPFHSADIKNITTTFSCQYGIDHITFVYSGKSCIPITYTIWYNLNNITLPYYSYPFGTLWSQIYASFHYPRPFIENGLATENIRSLIPMTPAIIGSRVVYPHEMNMSYALEKINSRLYDQEKWRAIQFIKNEYKANHVNIKIMTVHLEKAKIQLYSYFVPAYIYEFQMYNVFRLKVINGYNGNIYGNREISVAKTMVIGGGIGLFGTIGSILLGLTPQLIIVRLLAATILSGGAFGIATYIRNIYDQSQLRRQQSNIKFEYNENKKYVETEEDVQRKNFSRQFDNEAFQHVHNIRLPIDKLKLLGLVGQKDIMIFDLKNAYHLMIKKWHPDQHPNKVLAESMTKQIIIAYNDLVELLKNKN